MRAAERQLSAHHGGGSMVRKGTIKAAKDKPPRHDNKSRDPWKCGKCDHRNKATDMQCTGCRLPKGLCFGEKIGKTASPTVSRRNTELEAANKKLAANLKQLEAGRKQLAAERKKFNAEVKSSPSGRLDAADAPVKHEQSQDDGTKTEIKELRQQIKELNDVPEQSRHYVVDFDKLLASKQARIQELSALERSSRPLTNRKASAEAHLDKMSKSYATSSKKLEELKRQRSELDAKLACQEVETAELIAKVEAAKIEVANISELIAADLRGDSIIIEESSPCDGKLDSQEAALLRNLLKLVPDEKFNEACASSGVDADDARARTMALLSKVGAAEQMHEPAPVFVLSAHRPPVAAAAADEVWGAHCDNIEGLATAITGDANDLRVAQLQSEIDAQKAHIRELVQIWADVHNDLETEPSAQSSTKRKKLGDFGSAISRLVEA